LLIIDFNKKFFINIKKSSFIDRDDFLLYIEFFKKIFFSYEDTDRNWYFETSRIDEICLWFTRNNFEYTLTSEANAQIEILKAQFTCERIIDRHAKFNVNLFSKQTTILDFQIDAINWFLKRNVALNFSDTGAGKTIMTIGQISQLFYDKKIDACFLGTPGGTQYNWKKYFLMFSTIFKEEDFEIVSNDNKDKIFEKCVDKKIIIFPVHLLKDMMLSYKKGYKFGDSAKLIRWKDGAYCNINKVWEKDNIACVIDESHCFVYNTKIHTDRGILNIGDIVENKVDCKVLSYNVSNHKFEYKSILTYFKHGVSSEKLMHLHINGESTICTKNHPYFTKNFKFKAIEDFNGNENMWVLPKGIYAKNKKGTILQLLLFKFLEKFTAPYKGKKTENFAYYSLKIKKRKSRNVETYLFRIFRKNEKRQSGQTPRSNTEVETYQGGKWEFACLGRYSWRKWNRVNRTSTNIIGFFIKRLDTRICSCYKRKTRFWFSHLLQNRYRTSYVKNRNRSGWAIPPLPKGEITRFQEKIVLGESRLDSIAFCKQNNIRKLGYGFKGNTEVYNIEISDNNNYFANDILVHNCFKRSGAVKTKALLAIKKYFKYRLLLSATPNITKIEDIYSQFKFLDHSLIPMSEKAFRLWLSDEIDSYFDFNILKYNQHNVEILRSRYPLVMYQADVVMATKKETIPIYVEMHKDQKRLYSLICKKQIEDLYEEYDVIYHDLLENKLHQICAVIDCPETLRKNNYKDPEITNLLKKWDNRNDPKLTLLKSKLEDYIENRDEKVVVFASSPDVLDILAKMFSKYNPLVIHGSLQGIKDTGKDRTEKEELFNIDPKYKLMLLSTHTSSRSINLQKMCHRIIYYNVPLDPEELRQGGSRTHRITSTVDTIVELIIMDNTYDVIRFERAENRIQLNDSAMKELTQERLKNLLLGIVK
jgi:hypothetical protein